MMEDATLWMAVVGAMVLVLISLDAVWSVLSTDGGGPLTSRIAQGLWRTVLTLHRRRNNHRLLEICGVGVLLAVVAFWIFAIWAGWTMIFCSSPEAIIDSTTRAPADGVTRFYFTGYTIFTLGLGDYVPGRGPWRVLTALASAQGFFLITLSISYLIPVMQAATEKRQLALQISGLGSNGVEILARAWNGKNFGALANKLDTLSSQLLLQGERYLTYPVLHYLHSRDRRAATAPNVVALAEAVMLLCSAVVEEARPDEVMLRSMDEAIGVFLDRARGLYGSSDVPTPLPAPDLARLRREGVPLCSQRALDEALEAQSERRCHLMAFLRVDGWIEALEEDEDGHHRRGWLSAHEEEEKKKAADVGTQRGVA